LLDCSGRNLYCEEKPEGRQYIIGRWHVCWDPAATRQAYEAVFTGSPEECGCCYCRNFAAARGLAYPPEALSLFDRLGIDPRKEAEIWECCRLDSGLRCYGGFFHFVGSIEVGADAMRPGGALELEPLTKHFSWGLTSNVSLVRPPFAGLPLVQLEFSAQVPWVLEDHPEPA
jgi:hypothetical protein